MTRLLLLLIPFPFLVLLVLSRTQRVRRDMPYRRHLDGCTCRPYDTAAIPWLFHEHGRDVQRWITDECPVHGWALEDA